MGDVQTPTQKIAAKAGVSAPSAGAPCVICGGASGEVLRASAVLKSTFLDASRCAAWGSAWLCPSCAYLMGRTNPVPGNREEPNGPLGGGNFRNYSHVVIGDDYWPLSKGHKAELSELLRRAQAGCRWAIGLGLSGQKHSALFMRWGWVTTDDGRRSKGPDVLAPIPAIRSLLALGLPKSAIEEGQYLPRTWVQHAEALRAFEATWGAERGSVAFELALWLVVDSDHDEEILHVRRA